MSTNMVGLIQPKTNFLQRRMRLTVISHTITQTSSKRLWWYNTNDVDDDCEEDSDAFDDVVDVDRDDDCMWVTMMTMITMLSMNIKMVCPAVWLSRCLAVLVDECLCVCVSVSRRRHDDDDEDEDEDDDYDDDDDDDDNEVDAAQTVR